MRVLVLDNYDSFTWNLVDGLERHGAHCHVVRSDEVDLERLRRRPPDRLVVSPGPFGPKRSGRSIEAIEAVPDDLPVLGVCLGMQALAHAYGARVEPSGMPVHGKTRPIEHDGRGVFRGTPSPMLVGLYHSLVVTPESIGERLDVSARQGDVVMGLRCVDRSAEGVLFHPESFLTEYGDALLRNFLEHPHVVG